MTDIVFHLAHQLYCFMLALLHVTWHTRPDAPEMNSRPAGVKNDNMMTRPHRLHNMPHYKSMFLFTYK